MLGSLVGTIFTFDTAGIDFSMTALLRFLPFLIFNGNRSVPKVIHYLGTVLPYSIMGMLVVYCLRGISFVAYSDWLPELISVIGVVILHVWKRDTLLSINGGTACYMLLIRFVF